MEWPSWLQESDGSRVASRIREASRIAPTPSPPPDRDPPTVGAFQLEVCRDGQRLGRHVFTQAQVRVGRSPRCELHLDDPTVSRFHTSFEHVAGGYRVRDLRSSNGIEVNGKRVKGWQLSPGDSIRLGEFELVFRSDTHPVFRSERDEEQGGRPTLRLPGSTTRVANGRLDPGLRERSLLARAYLRPRGPRSRDRALQHVIERDAFILGSGARVDLRVDGWLVPRVVAVVVRGYEGHSLQPVSTWPRVKVNRRLVTTRCTLEDGDEIGLGASAFTFHVA
jgi:hypothetical protein